MSEEIKEETNNSIRKRINEIFPNHAISSALVNLVVNKKPVGWGRKSVAPYYTKQCGEQMKQDIDKMLNENGCLVYEYKRFVHLGISKKTLYQRLNQSIIYVIEQMDDEQQTYRKWYECVKLDKHSRSDAIVIDFHPGIRASFEGGALKVEAESTSGTIEIPNTMPAWRIEMEDFIENGKVGTTYMKDGLLLNKAEVDEFKKDFSEVKGLMFHVDFKTIKLVKG